MKVKSFSIIGRTIVVIAMVIAIVLVMLGIYRYNNSYTGSIAHVAKENKKNPIFIFNNQFITYTDKTTGADISSLVNTIIASNREYNEGKLKAGNLVSLKYDGLGSKLEDVHIVPDMYDIKEKEMLDFAKKIDKERYYYIDIHQDNEWLIDEVTISYLID